MKVQRHIAAFLIVTIMISMASIVGAANFPDVLDRHSWAKDYINDMVDRGILKGYPDGNFKPDNSISKVEALILAARIMGVNKSENEKYASYAQNAFKNDLEIYDIQYKAEVAYLLYRNVLKINELPYYIADSVKNTPLKRYEASVLLTKVMNAEKEVLNNSLVVLDFGDEDSIPASAKAYVDYVNKKGIMKGMEDNKFVPQGEVTRAMMATMMYRVEQANDITIVDATVVAASPTNSTISAIVNDVEEPQTFNVSTNTVIKIDGLTSQLVSLIAGVNIRVYFQGEEIVFIEAIAADMQFTAQGFINTVSTSNGVKMISIVQQLNSTEEPKLYSISDNCEFLLDGSASSFAALRSGIFVKIEVKSGKVSKVLSEVKETTYRGIVQDIVFDPAATVTVKISDGTIISYGFSSSATITRNGKTEEARAIGIGDTVEITAQYGAIKRLTATSLNKTTDVTIEEIVISANPKLVVKEGGVSKTYAITNSTKFIVDDKSDATIYDLRLSATAKLDLESGNISRIETKKLVIAPQLVGVINYIHPTSNVMGIDVVDSSTGLVTTTQAVVKSTVKIIDNTASKIVQFKQITPGRSVVVVGTVNYGVFEINTIIITQ